MCIDDSIETEYSLSRKKFHDKKFRVSYLPLKMSWIGTRKYSSEDDVDLIWLESAIFSFSVHCVINEDGKGVLLSELSDGRTIYAYTENPIQNGLAFISIRPEKIRLLQQKPQTTEALHVFEAKVEKIIFLGSTIEYRLRVGETEYFTHTFTSEIYPEGETVYMEIQPKDCILLGN